MKNMRNLKKQSGLALVEYIIAGILLASGVAAAWNFYDRDSRAQQSVAMRDSIIGLFAKTEIAKEQWGGSYNGYSNSTFWLSDELLPASMKSATANQFRTPYSENGLTFAPVSSVTNINGQTFNATDGWLSVVIRDVAEDSCVDEASRYLVDQVIQLNVGSTRINSQGAMDTACAAASGTINITVIGG